MTHELVLPAFATAHSHAFQRGMRGLAQRPTAPGDDFWSWRGQMYAAAMALTPETIYAISRRAYRELREAGVMTVGEFHYVHHQPSGQPYDDRTVLADAVILAAKDEGMRISLLRAVYHRAGPGRDAELGQRRFCDPTAELAMRDVETLLARYEGDPLVRIGLAPHSTRAVPPAWWKELAQFARSHGLPLHSHVSEQPREVEECIAETGLRPAEFLAEQNVLGSDFVGVHCTQLSESEVRLMGEARAFACVCPTTERDLGDGLGPIAELREAGARVVWGIDSHVICDPFEEMRSLETHARLRSGKRISFTPGERTPACALWDEASVETARSLGFADAGMQLAFDLNAPFFEGVPESHMIDALVFGGGAGRIPFHVKA